MNEIKIIKYPVYCIFVFVMLMIAPIYNLISQNTHQDHPWWVNLNAGPSLINTDFAMSAGMEYCYQFEKSVISTRIIGVTNKNPTIQNISPSVKNYKITDYGVLYGPVWQKKNFFFSISAGIGLVRISYEMPAESYSGTSISLPLEMQWFLRPTYFAGIGICTYASLNYEEQFSGIMIFVQLGVW